MKKVYTLTLVACLVTLFLLGCEKPGYLSNLGKARMGVVMESDKPLDPSLTGYLADQVRQHTKLTVIDSQALPQLADYANPEVLSRLQAEQKIDDILVCKFLDKGSGDYNTSFSTAPGGIQANLNLKRYVVLAYKIIAVPSGEILYTGQSEGSAARKSSISFGKSGKDTSASVDLGEERQIIQDAVNQALSHSGLY